MTLSLSAGGGAHRGIIVLARGLHGRSVLALVASDVPLLRGVLIVRVRRVPVPPGGWAGVSGTASRGERGQAGDGTQGGDSGEVGCLLNEAHEARRLSHTEQLAVTFEGVEGPAPLEGVDAAVELALIVCVRARGEDSVNNLLKGAVVGTDATLEGGDRAQGGVYIIDQAADLGRLRTELQAVRVQLPVATQLIDEELMLRVPVREGEGSIVRGGSGLGSGLRQGQGSPHRGSGLKGYDGARHALDLIAEVVDVGRGQRRAQGGCRERTGRS